MTRRLLITDARLVNEGRCFVADVLIVGERIARIDTHISDARATVIAAEGKYLLPGLIDTHVHFREPGYPQKGTIASESRAAVAGGVTSFLEMPNTSPPTTTGALLEDKYQRAARTSVANYGFYIGATEENMDELLRLPAGAACGVKVFMGSSTGNMLVEDATALMRIFSELSMLIAVHCEEESIIARCRTAIGEKHTQWQAADHPRLRPREACLASTKKALALAQQYGTQLHVLHITTKEELELFAEGSIAGKQITAEACLPHLVFCDADYAVQQNQIKVNPAIKTAADRTALWAALRTDTLDLLGSDHAPHTLPEKQQPYSQAPSGAPMMQHSLYVLLRAWQEGSIRLEQIVEKFCHNPARRYRIVDRGFLCEGYYADVVLFETCAPWAVSPSGILSRCGWSPLEGQCFQHSISEVIVSGQRVIAEGRSVSAPPCGHRLKFAP